MTGTWRVARMVSSLARELCGVDVVGVYNFACSLREVLAKHPFLPHGCGLVSGGYFPSFSEGLSLRLGHIVASKGG